MSEVQHTPEPWDDGRPLEFVEIMRNDGGKVEIIQGSKIWANVYSPKTEFRAARARRIMACVNACRGIPTKGLEEAAEETGGMLAVIHGFYAVQKERDGLRVKGAEWQQIAADQNNMACDLVMERDKAHALLAESVTILEALRELMVTLSPDIVLGGFDSIVDKIKQALATGKTIDELREAYGVPTTWEA